MQEPPKTPLILVLNCGSSSLKFAIMDAHSGTTCLSGLAESFYLPNAEIHWKIPTSGASSAVNKQTARLGEGASHTDALHYLVDEILSTLPELARNITAIGHRIVHGGEKFTQSTPITPEVVQGIQDAAAFAPLHNPPHLLGIAAANKAFPHLQERQVAVFDTAFHQTMPESAYLYALPYSLYRDHGVRRYGAHGTSHQYVSQVAAQWLKKPLQECSLISCHLGNGCSITAIHQGKSVDTSMGLTPLEGLVMGTRSGDIDPAIIFHLHDALGMSIDHINTLLTKKSGLLGITESTNDFRFIEENYATKPEAKRALDVFAHRLAKYIGAYSTCLEGTLDALIFTGGIGENAVFLRQVVLQKLAILGFTVDPEKNRTVRLGATGDITTPDSRTALVIPTNEEWMIAQETAHIFHLAD